MIRKAIIVVLTMLAVVVAVAWAASYVAPQVGGPVSDTGFQLWWLREGLFYVYTIQNGHLLSWNSSDHVLRLPGLQLEWIPAQRSGKYWRLYLYLWMPFVVFSIYPVITFMRGPLRRHRRRRKGLCGACGYDLTGNVTGVCSECGQSIGDGATA